MRTHHLFFVVAIGALLVGCQDIKRAAGITYTDQPVQWGLPANGLQVGLADRQYESGYAPMPSSRYVAMHLKNVSGKSLKVFWPDEPPFGVVQLPLAGDESLVVAVVNDSPAGKHVNDFKPRFKPIVKDLDPGESIVVQVRLARSALKPGTLVGMYSNQQSKIDYGGSGGVVSGIWTGSASSGPLTVEAPATAPSPK